LLTVETDGSGSVEVHVDEAGLDLLLDRLVKLRRHEKPDHDHLATPAWAGWELSERTQNKDNEIINLLTVYFHDSIGEERQ
jgi:hypothetical protein